MNYVNCKWFNYDFSYFLELDLIPAFVTFFCCLFWALEFGILVGVGIQVFFILYNSARPSIVIETQQVVAIQMTKKLKDM